MLSEWEKIKVHTKLVLEYKKRNHNKIFNWSAKQIAIDEDIDQAFKSMHRSIMKNIKTHARKDWVVVGIIINHSLRLFSASISRNMSVEKRR